MFSFCVAISSRVVQFPGSSVAARWDKRAWKVSKSIDFASSRARARKSFERMAPLDVQV